MKNIAAILLSFLGVVCTLEVIGLPMSNRNSNYTNIGCKDDQVEIQRVFEDGFKLQKHSHLNDGTYQWTVYNTGLNKTSKAAYVRVAPTGGPNFAALGISSTLDNHPVGVLISTRYNQQNVFNTSINLTMKPFSNSTSTLNELNIVMVVDGRNVTITVNSDYRNSSNTCSVSDNIFKIETPSNKHAKCIELLDTMYENRQTILPLEVTSVCLDKTEKNYF